MQIFTTVFISFILTISSPCVFAIKVSKETIEQGRQLMVEVDHGASQFLELSERVQAIITSYGPHSAFIIFPHLTSMNESIKRVVSSLSISKAYLTSLEKIVDNDPEWKVKKALKTIALPTGTPGQSIAIGNLGDIPGCSGGAGILAVLQEQKDEHLTELADKADKDISEFLQKALSYQTLNNSLKNYIDQNGIDDVLKIWNYLKEINKLLNELIILTRSFPVSFKSFLEKTFTYFSSP